MLAGGLARCERECTRILIPCPVQEPETAACDDMRHVLVGGEALPPALAARFAQRLPHAHLHNAYGPTETTVDATGGARLG